MDQINNERRSRQALAKQAREEAISTPRGVENKPTPVKVIGKRPPVSSVAPTTTETVIEETLEQKPATEVTKVEKEEVVKEPAKPVTKEKTKVKKEKSGGEVKMTTEAKKNTLEKVLHDINEETKLKDVMSNGDLDIKSVNKDHKVKILQAIFEEENLQTSDTKLGKIISKYENALCFLAKNGAKFKFGNAKQTEIEGYNILGATAVKPLTLETLKNHYLKTKLTSFGKDKMDSNLLSVSVKNLKTLKVVLLITVIHSSIRLVNHML